MKGSIVLMDERMATIADKAEEVRGREEGWMKGTSL
jgi:hypothetical protein